MTGPVSVAQVEDSVNEIAICSTLPSQPNSAPNGSGTAPKKCKAIPDFIAPVALEPPLGLHPEQTYEEYLEDPVCTLRWYNYKVNASIGSSTQTLRRVLTVIDTGAGPNLIREGVCPPESLAAIDTSRPIANLASASRHRLDTLGVVILTVKVATKVARVPFIVVRNLGADALLGCTYQDAHVRSIHCEARTVELKNGDVAPIIRRRALEPIADDHAEPKTIGQRAENTHLQVRCAERTTIPPLSEKLVRATCMHKGLRLLQARNDLYVKKGLVLANGVAEVQPFVPFVVRVANFSNKPQSLKKNERLGVALPTLLDQSEDGVSTIVFEGDEGNPIERENDHANDSSPDDTPRKVVTSASESAITVDDISLPHLDDEQQGKVREMLEPFAPMWQGQLGKVTVTEHRIDLLPGTRPHRSQPYRAGPEKR